MKPSLATTSSILAAAVAVVAAASIEAKPAAAAPKITLGTLKCKGHGGVGLILGSKEQMRCVFTTAVSARRHPYMATITKIGVDIGFTGESTLIWTVLGTTVDIAEGALEGGYGGVTQA